MKLIFIDLANVEFIILTHYFCVNFELCLSEYIFALKDNEPVWGKYSDLSFGGCQSWLFVCGTRGKFAH